LLFVPILVNLTFVTLLWRYGLTGVASRWVIDQLALQLPPAWTALVTIVSRFVDIVVFVLASYVALRFGAVLASPLYGHIAERVALVLPDTGNLPQRTAWADFGAALQYEWKKLLISLCFAVGGLLLALIPGVGIVVDVGWSIVVGMFFVSLDYTDAWYSRRGYTIRQRLAELRGVTPEVLGFVTVAWPLLSLPGVNLLAMPLCAAAGMLVAAAAQRSNTATATSSRPTSRG
jgi:CysZ protein